MLDVSEQGTVTRLKLLNPAGHQLDPIAIREAWKLTFEPARDRAKHPVRALMMWSFEWPSYWWMLGNQHRIDRIPVQVTGVPCRTSGPPSHRFRDCSKPDLTHAVDRAWIVPSGAGERPRR